jgi:hypothetical protein
MPATSHISHMEPRRYTLVPDDTQPQPPAASPVKRRYSLARVAPSSRSALGVDRLERMEEIAERERINGKPSTNPQGV